MREAKTLSAENDGTGIEINGCLDVFVLYGTGLDMRIYGANQRYSLRTFGSAEANAAYNNDVQLIVNNSSFDILSDNELGIKVDVLIRAIYLKRKKSA